MAVSTYFNITLINEAAEDWGDLINRAINQITESKTSLQERLGEIHHYAYPNGGHGDFSAFHRQVAKEAGYASVHTMIAGNVTERSDPFELPRIGIGNDTTAADLEYMLLTGSG